MSPTLSLVIPAYNEAAHITKTIDDVHQFLRTEHIDGEIIVVDDGSTDGTTRIVEHLMERISGLRVITLTRNEGKGAAIKHGVLAARGETILFMDADGSTSIMEYRSFRPHLALVDIVIGSRYLDRRFIHRKQPWYRVLIGHIGNYLTRLLLFNTITDARCGFKAFRRAVAKDLFQRLRTQRWAFDIELLAIARRRGYSIKEIPVHWNHAMHRKSRFHPLRDALRSFWDLLRIKMNLLLHRYD